MNIKEAMQSIDLHLIELQTKLPGQDEPAYYKPMTLELADRINAQCAAKGKEATDGYKLATSVVMCVLDKDGKKVFDAGDKHFLMRNVPQDVLIELVTEMGSEVTLEEAEKN